MTIKEFINENKNYIELQKCSMLLPKAESVMYSYLIDLESWDEIKHLPSDPSFFWANKEGFMDKYLLGWSIKEMTHAINNLVEAGYIETKVVNVDVRNRTYIKLNFNAYVRLNRLWENYKRVIPDLTKEELAGVRNACSQLNNIDTLELLIGEVIQTEVSNLRNQPYEPSLSSSTDVLNTSSEPSVQDVKDVKKHKRSNKDEVYNYVNSLSYNDDVKTAIKDWYSISKKKPTVKQLASKIDSLAKLFNYNQNLMAARIQKAFENGWQGWVFDNDKQVAPNNYTTNTYHSRTPEEVAKEREEIRLEQSVGEKF